MILVCLVIIATIFIANTSKKQKIAAEKNASQETNMLNLINTSTYIKDERTGYCFNFLWSGDYRGDPGYTHVPCEDIPEELLFTAPKE